MELSKYLNVTGMTQTEFAKKAGITVISLHRYMHFKIEPSASAARKIIEASNGRITLKDLTEPFMN